MGKEDEVRKMNIKKVKTTLKGKEYNFLKEHEKLGENIELLYVSGSYAYGLDTENSDVDIRGCALNNKREILLGNGFETISDNVTDTTIYSFKKFVNMLRSGNPNIIEVLGLHPDCYLYKGDIGKEILSHKDLFITQELYNSFKGYINSICKRMNDRFDKMFFSDKKVQDDENVQNYRKIIGKEMAHCIRLMVMLIDILSKGEVITYREKEHHLLTDLKQGKFINEENTVIKEFFDIYYDYDDKIRNAITITTLPSKPDIKLIDDFIANVHEKIIITQ